MKFLPSAALAISLLPMLALSASIQVNRETLKDEWPLTVDSGVLGCDRQAVTLTAKGITYALNGIATTQGRLAGWHDLRAIWKDNPAIPGTKISIGPMIQKGLLLCK